MRLYSFTRGKNNNRRFPTFQIFQPPRVGFEGLKFGEPFYSRSAPWKLQHSGIEWVITGRQSCEGSESSRVKVFIPTDAWIGQFGWLAFLSSSQDCSTCSLLLVAFIDCHMPPSCGCQLALHAQSIPKWKTHKPSKAPFPRYCFTASLTWIMH